MNLLRSCVASAADKRDEKPTGNFLDGVSGFSVLDVNEVMRP